MKPLRDISQQRFGRLTAVRFVGRRKNQTMWSCACDCGETLIASLAHLSAGHTRSCGCLLRDGNNLSHGHSRSPTYVSWSAMIQRCTNPNHLNFKHYGGRGIAVCERWLAFENFLTDMGERPRGLTLGRKENHLGYCKDNCRWENWLDQSNNRRDNRILEHQGKNQTIAQWERDKGLRKGKVRQRISRGWRVDRAIETA